MSQTADQIIWDAYAALRGDQTAQARQAIREGEGGDGRAAVAVIVQQLRRAGLTNLQAAGVAGLCALEASELATLTSVPTVSGTAKKGQMLTPTVGVWAAGEVPIHAYDGEWMGRTAAEADEEKLGTNLRFLLPGEPGLSWQANAAGEPPLGAALLLPPEAVGLQVRVRVSPFSGPEEQDEVPPGTSLGGFAFSAWSATVVA